MCFGGTEKSERLSAVGMRHEGLEGPCSVTETLRSEFESKYACDLSAFIISCVKRGFISVFEKRFESFQKVEVGFFTSASKSVENTNMLAVLFPSSSK
jgi:hypothetical protein